MPQEASWSGTPSIKGSTESMRMALLTFSLIGLQFTWGIEMTYGTPYLLQLGLSKSNTSMVWIAGPLSGLVMQPIVGMVADNSRSSWGRRRPFMIGGSIIVVMCLFVLGWTKEIVGLFVEDPGRGWWTIVLAILSIYAVDFAINAVQSSCRSLIVDTLPISKQQLGSAWASRMVAVGHLVGYGAGTLHLREIWGDWLGDTQFKQMIWIAATALLFAQGLTSWAVRERILISAKEDEGSSALKTVASIFNATLHLPNRIQAICWVQFWSWIGWFPFLFYIPTWVGETYFQYDAPASAVNSTDKLGEIGRIGSMALVAFSIVTFSGSVLLPLVIRSPDDKKRNFTPRPPAVVAGLLKTASRYMVKPDLLTGWLVSHVIFAVTMMLAPLVQSVRFATVLVATCGIPWALASWAPFAFMGIEINRLSAPTTMLANGSTYRRLSDSSLNSLSRPDSPTELHLDHDRDDPDRDTEGAASTGETAGIYLGILNVYTTLPQFVGTFISMIVFAIFEPGKSKILAGEGGEGPNTGPGPGAGVGTGEVKEGGVNSIAVCLFLGGVCSICAAYAAHRLRYVR